MTAPDHPHTDPGDGRTECQPCGKWVWPAIHSCKGVPVTAAARERRARQHDFINFARERDRLTAVTDRLAAALAHLLGVDIGEHVGDNDPWSNALDAAEAYPGQRSTPQRCPVCHGPIEYDTVITHVDALGAAHYIQGPWQCPKGCDPRTAPTGQLLDAAGAAAIPPPATSRPTPPPPSAGWPTPPPPPPQCGVCGGWLGPNGCERGHA